MIKRILAIVICACFALSLAACGCNSESGKGKTEISQADGKDQSDAKPAKAVVHGRISGDAAPTGWIIKPGENGDFITYIKGTEKDADKTYIQFGCDSLSAEQVFKSNQTLKESNGESYNTDSVTIGDKQFLAIYPDEGENSLFGTVNNNTMIINYLGVDIDDPVVQKIISGIVIAPEK